VDAAVEQVEVEQHLLAAGHGGQILLSHATAELAAERVPSGASLVVVRYLGRGRARAITARDMEKMERTRYQKRR
jgi:hypothetical protein